MKKITDAERQLKEWNPMSSKMIMIATPYGVKAIFLPELGIEMSRENSLRIHLVHSLKRRY